MATVPYLFAGQVGPIPLSELDANFASCKASTTLANTVADAAQANITSVGILSSLSVTGNVNGANLRTAGQVSATGNVSAASITATGSITAANIVSVGPVTASAFNGSGSGLTGIAAGLIVGNCGNALVANSVSAGGFTINESSGILYFSYNNTTIATLDSAGNFTAKGNVTAFGSI
jgi:hypothetical protein